MEKKMTTLEKKFNDELIKKYEAAQKQCECKVVRFLQTIAKFGGVKTAKEIIRKSRVSDDFETLKEAGLMGLTMEAMVIDVQYGDLFTDDEVNYCYDILCEHGYY